MIKYIIKIVTVLRKRGHKKIIGQTLDIKITIFIGSSDLLSKMFCLEIFFEYNFTAQIEKKMYNILK